jgi:hypothetical protein
VFALVALRRFFKGEVLSWFENRKPLIREQAFGESLDADKLKHDAFSLGHILSF